MKNMDEIIVALILEHNCVIIPSFGGFVSKDVSASIDFDKGTMLPPSKHLLFNIQLKNNDGLLTAALSRAQGINFIEANDLISKTVQTIQSDLKSGKKVSLENIGTFHYNHENILVFEQDRYFNFLLSSYGLAPLQFISNQTIEVVQPIKNINNKSNLWKYAAAACLLPFAFYSFWIPLKTNVLSSGMISYHDLNPFKKNMPQHYKLKNSSYKIDSKEDLDPTFENQKAEAQINDGVWVYQIDTEKSIYITADKTIVEEQPIIPVKNSGNGFNYVSPAAFNCIVGCYSQKENVEIFTKKLISNGFQVSLIQEGALTKVCIGQSNDAASLNITVEKAKSLGLEPWILH